MRCRFLASLGMTIERPADETDLLGMTIERYADERDVLATTIDCHVTREPRSERPSKFHVDAGASSGATTELSCRRSRDLQRNKFPFKRHARR